MNRTPPASRPRIVAIILAYNCGRMLPRALERIPKELVDEIFVMDDGSKDDTPEVVKKLGLKTYRHEPNRGYGGNLKEGMRRGLEANADYVVEIHGDGAQFDPSALYDALEPMKKGAQLILGSRFQQPMQALKNGMPLIRFIANRFLSFFDRLFLGLPLTEFHTGFRVYGRKLLETVPYQKNSNDYLFSFEIIAQAAYFDMPVMEVPVEADYKSEHTSHALSGAIVYAFQTFAILGSFLLARRGWRHTPTFPPR